MNQLVLTFTVLVAFVFYSKAQVEPRQPGNSKNEKSNIKWQEFTSNKGKFWALFPGKVNTSSEKIPTAVGEIDMHMFEIDKNNASYFIAYSDYPENLVKNSDPQILLESAKNAALNTIGSRKMIYEEKVEICGYPAIKSKAKGVVEGAAITFIGFQLMADNRLYQVYLFDSGNYDDLRAEKFINSFIIDRKNWVVEYGDGGKFRFSMPGKSTFSSQPTQTAVGAVDFNMHIFDQGNIAWFAAYSDFPDEHVKNSEPKTLLEGSYDGVVKNISSKEVLKKEYYKINGFDALRIDVKGNMFFSGQNIPVRYRSILAMVENRLYQIYSLSLNDSFDKEKAAYFEESFKLIKP